MTLTIMKAVVVVMIMVLMIVILLMINHTLAGDFKSHDNKEIDQLRDDLESKPDPITKESAFSPLVKAEPVKVKAQNNNLINS